MCRMIPQSSGTSRTISITLIMHAQHQATDTLLKEPLNYKEEHRRDARFEQHG
jgi:hypothetical protein